MNSSPTKKPDPNAYIYEEPPNDAGLRVVPDLADEFYEEPDDQADDQVTDQADEETNDQAAKSDDAPPLPAPPPAPAPVPEIPIEESRRAAEELAVKMRAANKPKFSIVHHDAIKPAIDVDSLIDGIFQPQSFAALFGAGGKGKTFYALRMAACIATGQPFNGREVSQGAVCYVGLEGGVGVRNRIAALKLDGQLPPGAPFYAMCDDSFAALVEGEPELLADAIAAAMPTKPKLLILDTLARSLVPGDESSSVDMGKFVAACDLLRNRLECALLVLHHTGKDASRGMRGSSALHGALDASMEIIDEGDARVVHCRKAKDLEPFQPHAFDLRVVHIGVSRRGKNVTSCVVDFTEMPETARQDKKKCNVSDVMAAIGENQISRPNLLRALTKRCNCSEGTAKKALDLARLSNQVSEFQEPGSNAIWFQVNTVGQS